ncbi:MAG: AP2 domain-containing protein [Candidatus Micrarchaeaceae archaeon]
MKTIQLTQGYSTAVDDANFGRVNAFKWYASVHKYKDGSVKNVYAQRQVRVEGKKLAWYMHRFIMGVTDPKMDVDHKDHDGLNNQEYNLRAATKVENRRNQHVRTDSISGVKGVWWRTAREKWQAKINIDGKQVYLGYFTDLQEAKDAYDAAALMYHGAFAFTNAMMEAQAEC